MVGLKLSFAETFLKKTRLCHDVNDGCGLIIDFIVLKNYAVSLIGTHSDLDMSSTNGTRLKRTVAHKPPAEHDEWPRKVVLIGICAMEKKVNIGYSIRNDFKKEKGARFAA